MKDVEFKKLKGGFENERVEFQLSSESHHQSTGMHNLAMRIADHLIIKEQKFTEEQKAVLYGLAGDIEKEVFEFLHTHQTGNVHNLIAARSAIALYIDGGHDERAMELIDQVLGMDYEPYSYQADIRGFRDQLV